MCTFFFVLWSCILITYPWNLEKRCCLRPRTNIEVTGYILWISEPCHCFVCLLVHTNELIVWSLWYLAKTCITLPPNFRQDATASIPKVSNKVTHSLSGSRFHYVQYVNTFYKGTWLFMQLLSCAWSLLYAWTAFRKIIFVFHHRNNRVSKWWWEYSHVATRCWELLTRQYLTPLHISRRRFVMVLWHVSHWTYSPAGNCMYKQADHVI